jgi:hypothetical protein
MSEENKEEVLDKPKRTLSYIDYKKASNIQIEKNLQELEEYIDTTDTILDNQRKKISSEINTLFQILGCKDYKQFMDLQSQTLALRQTIQEQITYFMQKLSKANANFKKVNADRIEYYMTGYGIKVSDGTRTKLIDRDLSGRERAIESYQNHIEFLRECRNSCDQVGYAVKNLVGLISYINILDK